MMTYPEDWKVVPIDDVATITTGDKNTQDNNPNGIYPFYVRSDIVERIDEYSFDTEGVVTAGDGVGTGKVFHYAKGKFGLHQRAYLIHEFREGVDPRYFYWFFSSKFYDRIHGMTAKSSVDSVRREMIADMPFAYPPLPEQQRIAAILGKVDALIGNLAKRIEKKRRVKQGVMHDLLTGKKRLPGFSGEWGSVKLSDVAAFSTETIDTELVELKWFVGTENMCQNRGGVMENKAVVPYKAIREYRKGDVLVSNIRPYLKKIWLADRHGGCSTDVLVVRKVLDNLASEYLYFILSQDRFFDYVMENAVGTKMPRGDKKIIMSYAFSLPSLPEQRAIAAVLSGMDAEIAKLEAKREKYARIKQGLMNDLLTGRVRV